jgi:hypothetical protein
MPTWGEIQTYARTKYKLSQDEPEKFSLIFAYDDGRTQQIRVRKFTAYDQDWIEFGTPVCKESEMAPKVALKKNSEFAIGALALSGELYVMLYSIPLANMDIEEFELPLHVLAGTADNLEQNFSAGNDEF